VVDTANNRGFFIIDGQVSDGPLGVKWPVQFSLRWQEHWPAPANPETS
jgi:hypothetical protein